MSGTRTEKPTPRRLEQARRQGRFAASREWVAGVQFLTFVWMLGAWGPDWMRGLGELLRADIARAFTVELTPLECRRLLIEASGRVLAPMLAAGGLLVLTGTAAHFAVTRLGISGKKLAPDVTRLNPLGRLRELPQQNLWQMLQALVLIPLLLYLVWLAARSQLALYMQLPFLSVQSGLRVVAGSIESLLWKSAVVLGLWGAVDWFRQHRRHQAGLKMSKQDLREEAKESEGNPQIKGRIRRLQRDAARRRMMQEVPQATAVVVNPTHYAVALRYDLDAMSAPRVVAKGKNYLALRIRGLAEENRVPIVENPPLAQSLYKSVDVGQEIPAALYRAVAEILAYIYQLRGARR